MGAFFVGRALAKLKCVLSRNLNYAQYEQKIGVCYFPPRVKFKVST